MVELSDVDREADAVVRSPPLLPSPVATGRIPSARPSTLSNGTGEGLDEGGALTTSSVLASDIDLGVGAMSPPDFSV